MADDDESKKKLEIPKSATGTVLGVPRPEVPIDAPDVTIPDAPPKGDAETRTVLDAEPPNITMPLDAVDIDELAIPPLSQPKPGSGTVKGLGPTPRAADPCVVGRACRS